MKKILVVGLLVLVLIVVGFVFIQNARAHGPMMGRGSWLQPSTWNWGTYCPWNNWGSRSFDYPGYQRGNNWGGCGMMNQGWGPGYSNPPNPQAPQQPPQGQ